MVGEIEGNEQEMELLEGLEAGHHRESVREKYLNCFVDLQDGAATHVAELRHKYIHINLRNCLQHDNVNLF